MNQIKLNDSLTIESVDIVWPDELGFTARFEIALDNVPYSLHMQTHEIDGMVHFTDAPFYGERSDWSKLFDLLSESDCDLLLSECRVIYKDLKKE